MSDDLMFKMYETQAELVEAREKLEKIQKENDELRNQMTANSLIKKVDDFQKSFSNRLETIEENLRTLTITVSNNYSTLSEIKETTKIQKENEKWLVDDHTKLSETVEAMQVNLDTLSTKGVIKNCPKLMTLRKQNETIHILKNNTKIMDNETILLLGGRNENKMADSLLILQSNEDNDGNWKELSIKLPYSIYGHGAQFLNNHLYIFGGENEKDLVLNWTYKLTRGHKWITNSLQWEDMADMNEKRMKISNSNVILNDRIWVFGGFDGKNALKSVERYNPQTNRWKKMRSMNECRLHAAAAVVNGKIFCCGGYDGKNNLKSAECYDPSSDAWTRISDMPIPIGGCGVVVIDAHLIVIGGEVSINTYFFKSALVLDTADKNARWIEKEPCMSLARCQFSIAKVHDKIFVCGGVYIDQKDSKLRSTNNVEIFDGEVWRNGSKLTSSLCNTAAVVIPMEFTRSLLTK